MEASVSGDWEAGHGNAWPVIMNGRLICQASVIFFSGCLMKSRDAIEFQAFGWDAPDHFNDLFGLSLKSTLLDCEMHSLPGDAQFLRRFGDCVSLLGCFLGRHVSPLNITTAGVIHRFFRAGMLSICSFASLSAADRHLLSEL